MGQSPNNSLTVIRYPMRRTLAMGTAPTLRVFKIKSFVLGSIVTLLTRVVSKTSTDSLALPVLAVAEIW
jgi:hypothetical protein